MKRWGVLFSAILILATVTSAQASIISTDTVGFFLTGTRVTQGTAGAWTIEESGGNQWTFASYSAAEEEWQNYLAITNAKIVFGSNTVQFQGNYYDGTTSTPFTLSGTWETFVLNSSNGTGAATWSNVLFKDLSTSLINSLFSMSGVSYLGSVALTGTGNPVKFKSGTSELSAVPIPSAVLLLASGLISLVAIRRRKAK